MSNTPKFLPGEILQSLNRGTECPLFVVVTEDRTPVINLFTAFIIYDHTDKDKCGLTIGNWNKLNGNDESNWKQSTLEEIVKIKKNLILKAWLVYEYNDPSEGCLLVYASSRNKARLHALREGMEEYIEIQAVRKPILDVYARGYLSYVVWFGGTLPDVSGTYGSKLDDFWEWI